LTNFTGIPFVVFALQTITFLNKNRLPANPIWARDAKSAKGPLVKTAILTGLAIFASAATPLAAHAFNVVEETPDSLCSVYLDDGTVYNSCVTCLDVNAGTDFSLEANGFICAEPAGPVVILAGDEEHFHIWRDRWHNPAPIHFEDRRGPRPPDIGFGGGGVVRHEPPVIRQPNRPIERGPVVQHEEEGRGEQRGEEGHGREGDRR
jgi:hypothetical protein